MHEFPDSVAEDPFLPPWVWNRALVWSMLGLVAWAGFELTAQPAVVAAVVCSKVGWNNGERTEDPAASGQWSVVSGPKSVVRLLRRPLPTA